MELRRFLTFRITFFSKPHFLDAYITGRSEELGTSFVVRQLTEKESEDVVDVDKVADILNIPLDYILKDKRTYIFNIQKMELPIKLYISQYYILAQIETSEINIDTLDLAKLLGLELFLSHIDIADIALIDDYFAGCKEKELWTVLDREAFGDLDIDSVVESRYADTHLRGRFNADLIRRIIKRENSENILLYQVFIKSIISLANIDTQHNIHEMNVLLNSMKYCAEQETTRCFSNEFSNL